MRPKERVKRVFDPNEVVFERLQGRWGKWAKTREERSWPYREYDAERDWEILEERAEKQRQKQGTNGREAGGAESAVWP